MAYIEGMTRLMRKALEELESLPADRQDEIARAILNLVGHDSTPEPIDSAHLPAVLEGLAQAQRGDFAGDAEVERAFRRFDE
jgi:hypothetical protein